MRGRLKIAKVLKASVLVLVSGIVVLALGELIAYVCALICGARFKLFGVIHGITFDNLAMLVSTVVIALVCVLVYLRGRAAAVRKTAGSMRANAGSNAAARYAADNLYGVLLLMLVLSAALVFTLGENLMFFIPLAFATAAMILYRLTSLKLWLLAAIALILIHAFSFLHALAMALTIGAFGAVAMLAFFDIMLLIPMADMYLTSHKKQ